MANFPCQSERVPVKRRAWVATGRLFLAFLVFIRCSNYVRAQSGASPSDNVQTTTPTVAQLLEKLDELVQQNQQLESHNRELMDQIEALRKALSEHVETPTAKQETQSAESSTNTHGSTQVVNAKAASGPTEEPYKWGAYTPNLGYKVANTEHGDLSISIYSYGRYLNQLGLNSSYTDAFGNVKSVQRRQDFQLNKVQMKFLGWLFDPKFRYFLYAWTSNASQGLGAQVVLAGNLNYTFNKFVSVGSGIRSLPGTRSVEGNFPFWLGVDTRLISDEFFRPSYTSGVWAWGQITDHLDYIAMVGNNLSTLGVSAAQLNNGFNTISTSLVWTPTTGEFGPGFGDFEDHHALATRLGAHFTRSDEDKQSQPNSDQFENTQIRLEDGSVIFTPNLFGQGISITNVTYKMAAFDGGLKYHGWSLDGEYFLRWLDHFQGPGTSVVAPIFSHGFQLQTSAMVLPKALQLYVGGSTVNGKYGDPWDFRAGVNFFPFHNKVVRWNTEFLYLHKSPVGYTSVPFALGGMGSVVHTNLEVAF